MAFAADVILLFFYLNKDNKLANDCCIDVIFLQNNCMIMQIKIFVNEKPIYLTNALTKDLKELSLKNNTILIENKSVDATALLKKLDKKKYAVAILQSTKIEILKNDFFSQFDIIEAAGGIVQNENKDILFIFRRGKWDLPKGKLEEGESIETCAVREIEEETGISHLTLKRKIGETYHIYEEKGKTILKISHWFYFTCPSSQKMVAQTEEDIAEVKWIATQNIKEPMANTYNNIKEILATFFDTP
jgi:ADP-ribose pyrophosphatase YjhB (NUDIX family)